MKDRTGIAAVGRDARGLSSGRAQADADVPTGTGLPPGGPETTSLGLMPVGDELLARAVRFAIVEEGSGDGYEYRPEQIWSRTSDWSTWLLADDALPRGAEFARRGDGPLEVAFSSGDDPADNDLADGLAGTVAWARSPGQPWTEVGLIVSGPGGDSIDDGVPVGAGFVAVGSTSVRDEQGVSTFTPSTTAASSAPPASTAVPP